MGGAVEGGDADVVVGAAPANLAPSGTVVEGKDVGVAVVGGDVVGVVVGAEIVGARPPAADATRGPSSPRRLSATPRPRARTTVTATMSTATRRAKGAAR